MAEGWQSGPFGRPSPTDRRASCPRELRRAALNPSGYKRLCWPASPAAPDVSEADLLSFVAWPGFTSSPSTISGKWASRALAFYSLQSPRAKSADRPRASYLGTGCSELKAASLQSEDVGESHLSLILIMNNKYSSS